VDAGGAVVEFLSYEGTFIAAGGPAAGRTSTDIGVSEPGTTPIGQSLQRIEDAWTGPAQNTFGSLNTAGGPGNEPVINEFSASTAGTDVEYVEVFAEPGTDLSSYSVLEIEGDASATVGATPGTIDGVVGLGTSDVKGLFNASLTANDLENGSITLLLVKSFTGAAGTDLDTNDDGTLDVTPWASVVDSVAVNDGGSSDRSYSSVTLVVSFDGLPFAPGGASRIPDGTDSGSQADWVRNDFDLAGIPGFPGTPVEGEAYNTPGAPNEAVPPPPPVDTCGDPNQAVALISDIQGSGATFASGCAGPQTLEAVVTAIKPGLDGVYLQEEAADSDGDSTSSEGIFVHTPSTMPTVEVGDAVRVTGTVAEYTGGGSQQTQLTSATFETMGDGAAIEVTDVTFPVESTTYLERFEGMLVNLSDTLVISEYFDYDRFGEIVLGKPLPGEDRLYTPTAVVEPGADAQELAEIYRRSIITLDDANSSQNPDVIPHPGNGEPFTATNTFRGGDTVTGVLGVIDDTFRKYRIQPTTYGTYAAKNPRPDGAPEVGGTIQVASYNVLNYFLTLDDGKNDICGANQRQECRGADSKLEFERQRTKILEALSTLDADVVGLMEMENTPGVEPAADLVAGLNEMLGAHVYDYIDTGVLGTDAIRVGLLYKRTAVKPVDDFAILDSSVDPRFDSGANRPMLTQTFVEVSTGGRFTVSVNHLKSKGSACAGDPDTGDGQGNCNVTRTAAAEAIVDFLASDPTGTDEPDHLVIGDLNSYDMEDPIDVLVGAGYTDQVKKWGGERAYGYVFDGMAGYLDHALSNASLTSQVTGAAEWHINADEPDILDYNLDFGRSEDYFTADAVRGSDHDAVLVGLELAPGNGSRPAKGGHGPT
jgi:hypothetical protein